MVFKDNGRIARDIGQKGDHAEELYSKFEIDLVNRCELECSPGRAFIL